MNLLIWRRLALAASPIWMALYAGAAIIGTNPPAPSLSAERLASLPAAERSAWEDCLTASRRQKLADQAALAAERGPGQPLPPAPESGHGDASMPLDKAAAWYGGAQARQVADNIVSFQTPAGGWGKNQPRDQPPRLRAMCDPSQHRGSNLRPMPSPGRFTRTL